jgi:hypothetical protein
LLSQEGARLLAEFGLDTPMGRVKLIRVDDRASCFARIITSLSTATARGEEGAAAEVPYQPAGTA